MCQSVFACIICGAGVLLSRAPASVCHDCISTCGVGLSAVLIQAQQKKRERDRERGGDEEEEVEEEEEEQREEEEGACCF